MMGERLVMQESQFYEFRIEDHVPCDQLLRRIDRFVDCSGLRQRLADSYGATGLPSVDPELMIRMLLIGYCLGIRSDRRLCEEVHLNLAYRWFRRLGDFSYDPDADTYTCPEGKTLTTNGRVVNEGTTRIYRGSTFDCGPCHLGRCCPKTQARKIPSRRRGRVLIDWHTSV